MATFRYRSADLLSLRESPLVAKPSGLPDVQQWIEQQNDRNKQRRHDEGDDGQKRPTLAQTRNRPSQSGELFLGPKMSFAAASAHRKEGDRSFSEEYKEKIERTARDSVFRVTDRNGNRREPRENANGYTEDGQRRNGGRRPSGGETDRPRMKLTRQRAGDGHNDEELQTPRRTGIPEKLNKPWFRDANDTSKHMGDRDLRSPMRDRWGRDDQNDQNPAWMDESLAPEGEVEAQNQQDFAAWKEMMKGRHAAKDSVTKTPTTEAFGNNEPLMSPALDQPLFGTWGQSLDDEKKNDEVKKPAKPVKVSRFFGGGAVPKQKAESVTPESPKFPLNPALPEDNEERKAFNDVLQKLRVQGSISQSHNESAFAPPAMHQSPPHKQPTNPTPPSISPPRAREHPRYSPYEQAAPLSPHENIQSPHAAPPKQAQPQPDRNAEFFLNLLKHSQPRAPFQEGQIYGQNYNQRREQPDIASFINGVSPQPAKQQQRPPPGFSDNQRGFNQNNYIDVSGRGAPTGRPHEDHFSPPLNMRPEEHRGPNLPDFRFPPQSGFPPQSPDFGPPPPGHHQRHPSPDRVIPLPGHHQRPPSRDRMIPPPGFTMRPNVPPGFPSFGAGQNGHPNMHAIPQMRATMPMQLNGHPPPGFGPGPPPGMGPQPNGRRMPSGSVPPGFDVYGDPQRRGGAPPPMPQSSYSQYLKQGGGPGAYQGM